MNGVYPVEFLLVSREPSYLSADSTRDLAVELIELSDALMPGWLSQVRSPGKKPGRTTIIIVVGLGDYIVSFSESERILGENRPVSRVSKLALLIFEILQK
ncbi:MAG: hypothetical protein SVV03_06775 [Candidatus Nanohaloarchaea archaeon]|nr:hypothetical protein [Candidatus Nanohaloarchaea archaeon]